ncbi:WD40-repeat-containing domain protein [Rhypophila decipiens]|uniref:WD40-repeat-containing domain protein n=1 Tax=Rhypophila decipiens TaxID=261697 RepID=A0AAN6YID8_9PEZI|nr:WD40-repeat-containing domain protein [Rhypophila decipiens]
MRLLRRSNDGKIELTDFMGDVVPKYAILSHTWLPDNSEEVTFEDMSRGSHSASQAKPNGFKKIQFCGEQAARDGLEFFWVDTCCIKKESSTELQEALTSMFAWYRNSARCYVYLTDVTVPDQAAEGVVSSTVLDASDRRCGFVESWEVSFRESRWWTRGWTLQELIAPSLVEFFSVEGTLLGTKASLVETIHRITGIPAKLLKGEVPLTSLSTKERLTWAEGRQTKRPEDRAYCLLGILNVFMTVIYGEGEHAFERLHEKLDKAHYNRRHMLGKLPVASQAHFNSVHNQHEQECLANTRVDLLRDIEQWIDNGPPEQSILWLSGIAGTGKSTIARTIARTYNDRGSLGASFFFSRGGGDLSNASKLVTTLARQLCTQVPAIEGHIYEAMAKHENLADSELKEQWHHLILTPIKQLQHNRDSSPSTILMVLDALDECDNEKEIRLILKLLPTSKEIKNTRLRILVTSRPEIYIRSPFKKIPEGERQVCVLHEIAPETVNSDLNLYFTNKFMSIRDERDDLDEDWPGLSTIKHLVKISYGLFIWAATACRFIEKGKGFARERMQELIRHSSKKGGPAAQLDQIYIIVLQNLVKDYGEDEKVHARLRKVLGSIVILLSPLSVESISKLTNIRLRDIESTLADLHTIFHVPSQKSHPIRPHHPTFRDFLLDKERCSDANFWVDEKEAHKAAADSCIDLMSKRLKRDICGLKSPGTLLKDVDPDLIEAKITPELQYAILYWAQHYRQSGVRLQDDDKVHKFFQQYFLHWLEAINLMGKSAEMAAIIRMYHALLVPDLNHRQLPFVKDARRYIFAFQSIIKLAPLQTYSAALVFVPATNELRRHFRGQLHPWIQDVHMAKTTAAKARDEFNYVNDLAFTPDSKKISSGANIEVARLWDVSTKSPVRKFEGPTDKVSSVSISPDGGIIACGADDFTIAAWDIETGATRYSIKDAHSSWVNSVMFSPDGAYLASGSMDETVAIWDAETGKSVVRFDNQGSCVNSTAYSPDGELIATGSEDAVIRLWDVSECCDSGEEPPIKLVLDNHSGCVNSVRFSPDGRHLVSGSDDMTVKLWDVANGDVLATMKGHTRKIMAVTFSPDATLLLSGSEDRTVMIWDAASGALVRKLEGHTSGINAVVFSPDAQLLATCSFDDEIRFWDAKTWEPKGKVDEFGDDELSRLALEAKEKQSKAHSGPVTSVVFSPGGQYLASASADSTIKVWIPSKGAFEHLEFKHESRAAVNHLSFSPDGGLLASASADKTIKLWDTKKKGTGKPVHSLEGHTDGVVFTVFSHNGKSLVSRGGPNDPVPRLWDVKTGKLIQALDGDHSGPITSVAFSPDGRFVASSSTDTTIVVWELASLLGGWTGWIVQSNKQKRPFAVLRGHSGPVNGIAFSEDGQLLASCSNDGFIRLWAVTRPGAPTTGIIRAGGPDGSATQRVLSVAISSAVFYDGTDGSMENGGNIVKEKKKIPVLASCSAGESVVRLWDIESVASRGVVEAGAPVERVGFKICCADELGRPKYIDTDRGLLDLSGVLVEGRGEGGGNPLMSPDLRTLSLSDANAGWEDIDYSKTKPKTTRKTLEEEDNLHALFVTKDWLTKDTQNAIWLPEDYRPTCLATCGCTRSEGSVDHGRGHGGQVVILGHENGALSFIYM